MSGNRIGGKKAAEKNKRLYGEDFYRVQGAKGGKLGTTGGFACEKRGADGLTGRERARIAGAKGGKTSKRTGPRTKTQYISKKPKKSFLWGLFSH